MNLNATLWVQCGVFFLLSWFTMRYVWPPLIKVLDERAKTISDGLEFSRQSEKSLKQAHQQAKEIVSRAHQEARDQKEQASKQAAQMIEQAQDEASHLLAKAQKDADESLVIALQKGEAAVRYEALRIGLLLAQKVLQREVDSAVHAQWLDEVSKEI